MTVTRDNEIAIDEKARLDALRQYNILDTDPETVFDDIVQLAALICDTPMATVTLVDENRQWFKSRRGLTVTETPRHIAFCSHAIIRSDPFIVHDALADPRFSDNPLVQGVPNIRFYVGIPLVNIDGHAVGTLTVMDHRPRMLSDDQVFALRVLAHQALTQLESRRSIAELNRLMMERDQAQLGLQRMHDELEARVHSRTRELALASAAHQNAELLYRTLWETTTDAVLILDMDDVIRYANPSTLRVLGYTPEELIGKDLATIQPERFREAHRRGKQRYLQSGLKQLDWRSTEARALLRDGTELPVEIAFSGMALNGRRLFVGFFRDITERKKAEAALFEEKERAQATLKSIGDAVVSADVDGKITFLNPIAEQLTGWRNDEAVGHMLSQVLNLVDEDNGTPVSLSPDMTASGRPAGIGSRTLLIRRDGEQFSIEGSVARLLDRERHSTGCVIAFRDVSLARKLAAQLSHQARHDPLTGLVNRMEFERRLRLALDRVQVNGVGHCLLYLDLDQFKVVNDTCGHVAGDELLRQLSAVLRLNLRDSDTLARLGGDEFGILLESCPPDAALRIAEKLRQAVAEHTFAWEDKRFTVGVSIGRVNFDDDTLTLAEILSNADAACYVAKERGRNRIHTYLPQDQALAARHGEMEWISRINSALDEHRFCLYMQPIIDLRSKAAESSASPSHIEVLLRMRDQDGQMVLPMAFIPAAERYNLMPALDRWVIRSVFAHIASRPGATPACFAINLSGASLADEAFLDFVRGAFAESGIPPSQICFEITETIAIANLVNAVALMGELKALGCSFALDDFGSGMSSFAYLKHLPVDFLKIDGCFVRDIVDDPIDHAMVASIHHIGHLMGIRTIAEFVENDLILGKLREIGIDFAQGNAIGQAAPLILEPCAA
ncbi:MAG TPA: EAL domain-containing protein [Noviherbaspirillum sp.]|uniref:EAL domain-containing protein n=1 Tax=Noviherbaspirillum sp. TaxID=1926288 RepID=UPI002DDDA634|nr:EAL domain-containing protein [Noviherbaspirillum sp.]HEV2610340.1 EAL domain-containing protein [Noviherbaspirillum sp.]